MVISELFMTIAAAVLGASCAIAVFAVVVLLFRKLLQRCDYYGLERRMREEQAVLRNQFMDASAQIIWETAKYRFGGGSERSE